MPGVCGSHVWNIFRVAQNFEVAPVFLEDSWTPGVKYMCYRKTLLKLDAGFRSVVSQLLEYSSKFFSFFFCEVYVVVYRIGWYYTTVPSGYSITQCNRVIFEKPLVSQLDSNFSDFVPKSSLQYVQASITCPILASRQYNLRTWILFV